MIDSQFDPESFLLPQRPRAAPQEELSQATDPPTLALEPVEPEPVPSASASAPAVTPVVSPKGAGGHPRASQDELMKG